MARTRVIKQQASLLPEEPQGAESSTEVSLIERRTRAAVELISAPDSDTDIYFHHATLCQVGIPRKRTDARTFERRNGLVSVELEAGRAFDGSQFRDIPLPYGTRPRLVLVYASTFALQNKKRNVDVGGSLHQFMKKLDIDTGGRSYATIRAQTLALAAARMTIGVCLENGAARTIKTDGPVEEFDLLKRNEGTQGLWPEELVLSEKFYESLREFAVPMNPVALKALSDTALGMDIYTWLTHRLYRIKEVSGVHLTWANLKDQFGQEYRNIKHFREEFTALLHRVKRVYPDAKIESEGNGFRLHQSKPPVAPTKQLPRKVSRES